MLNIIKKKCYNIIVQKNLLEIKIYLEGKNEKDRINECKSLDYKS